MTACSRGHAVTVTAFHGREAEFWGGSIMVNKKFTALTFIFAAAFSCNDEVGGLSGSQSGLVQDAVQQGSSDAGADSVEQAAAEESTTEQSPSAEGSSSADDSTSTAEVVEIAETGIVDEVQEVAISTDDSENDSSDNSSGDNSSAEESTPVDDSENTVADEETPEEMPEVTPEPEPEPEVVANDSQECSESELDMQTSTYTITWESNLDETGNVCSSIL